jgi:hypothetical protein
MMIEEARADSETPVSKQTNSFSPVSMAVAGA